MNLNPEQMLEILFMTKNVVELEKKEALENPEKSFDFGEGKDRHCAFCSVIIPQKDVKKCAKCHKRAYCSRKCQAEDWRSKAKGGHGQGHKNWCGIQCLEEDLDFEIVPSGPDHNESPFCHVAKRMIPSTSRIYVQGLQWNMETTKGFADICKSVLINNRKLTRLSHACNANATTGIDGDFKVLIVYAKRDIGVGELITVSYTGNNEGKTDNWDIVEHLFPTQSLHDSREKLMAAAIICPQNCFCRDEEIEKMISKGNKLKKDLFRQKTMDMEMEAAIDLDIVKKLLKITEKISSSNYYYERANILQIGFCVAIQQQKTLMLGMDYISECYQIWSSILHPQNSGVKNIRGMLNSPQLLPNFLFLSS